MAQSFNSRTALVTGSTRGLGLEMSLELARAGVRVAMNYFGNETIAQAAFAELQAVGGDHCLVRGDVTDQASIDRLVAEVESKIGGIDILVLNATCAQPELPIEEYDWDFYQRMVDFFMKSPFLLTKACLPHMRQQKWGRIIHITSEIFGLARTHFCPYASAKGGQIGLARSTATELAPAGITVNMVAPGWIPVERHKSASAQDKSDYVATVPVNRIGVPADISAAVLYLASEEASFVTGVTIDVNGGHMIS